MKSWSYIIQEKFFASFGTSGWNFDVVQEMKFLQSIKNWIRRDKIQNQDTGKNRKTQQESMWN
jgi:hypothetical protein